MNPIVLLMGLLGLAYLGSFLVGGRAIRGFGLPSGAEYITLGFLFGPWVLGLVDRTMLGVFEPVAMVALGWLAFVIGVGYGFVDGRRVRLGPLLAGNVLSATTGAAVAGAAWLVAWRFAPTLGATERWLLAGGVGAVCAETTRHAVRWVVERHAAHGPLADLLGDLADSDDLVPLVATAALFAIAPSAHAPGPLHAWHWVGITVGLGVALGLIGVALIARDLRRDETWAALLGIAVLGIGVAARLGLSALAIMFVAGWTLTMLSRRGAEVRAFVEPTEKPVLLPALLLAGAHLDLQAAPFLPWLVASALGARVVVKSLGGLVITTSATARGAGPLLGVGMLSSGALAMSVGLLFALRFPGRVGDSVLVVATASTLLGEFLGPATLRLVLARAGAIDAAARSDEDELLADAPATPALVAAEAPGGASPDPPPAARVESSR